MLTYVVLYTPEIKTGPASSYPTSWSAPALNANQALKRFLKTQHYNTITVHAVVQMPLNDLIPSKCY